MKTTSYKEQLIKDLRDDLGLQKEYLAAAKEEGDGAYQIALKDVEEANAHLPALPKHMDES